MERARQLISAMIAGGLIGMGATVYLTQQNPVVGSFLFAIGLFTIVIFQLQLFTGKVGYLPMQKPIYLIELGITWLGNLLGTYLVAMMVKQSRIYDALAGRVQEIADIKLNDGVFSILILSIFCGFLMFIAVDVFKNQTGSTIRTIGIFVPVMVFILSGFEHVIANMFYFSLSNSWNMHCLVWIVVMTLGNSIGGMLLPLYMKCFRIRE